MAKFTRRFTAAATGTITGIIQSYNRSGPTIRGYQTKKTTGDITLTPQQLLSAAALRAWAALTHDQRSAWNSIAAPSSYEVTAGGSGYTTRPSAVMQFSGFATEILDGGKDYADPPIVNITSPQGGGFSVQLAVVDGSVIMVDFEAGGGYYGDVTFTVTVPPAGSGFAIEILQSSNGYLTPNITNAGSGYTGNPIYTADFPSTPGGWAYGSGGNLKGVVPALITGAAFTVAPVLTVGGPGSGATALAYFSTPNEVIPELIADVASGAVSALELVNQPYQFLSSQAPTISGGGGSGATAAPVFAYYAEVTEDSLGVDTAPTGYSQFLSCFIALQTISDTLTPPVTPPTATPWRFAPITIQSSWTQNFDTFSIGPESVGIGNPGWNYSSEPTIEAIDPHGSGFAGHATINAQGGLASVVVTANGSGYTQAVTFAVIGGGGTRGTVGFTGIIEAGRATAPLANQPTRLVVTPNSPTADPDFPAYDALDTAYTAAQITNSGYGLTSSSPVVIDTEGQGSGAAVSFTLDSGHVSSVTVTAPGFDQPALGFWTIGTGAGRAFGTLTGKSTAQVLFVYAEKPASLTLFTKAPSGYQLMGVYQSGGAPYGDTAYNQGVIDITAPYVAAFGLLPPNGATGHVRIVVVDLSSGYQSKASTGKTSQAGGIWNYLIGAGGSGYTSPPTWSDPTGFGYFSDLALQISGGAITSATVKLPGWNYPNGQELALSGGGGSGGVVSINV